MEFKTDPPKPETVNHSAQPEPKEPGKAKKRYSQAVFRDWCKACGICSAFCPKHVIEQDDRGAPVFVHPDRCVGCRLCEYLCPDFAITIEERPLKPGEV